MQDSPPSPSLTVKPRKKKVKLGARAAPSGPPPDPVVERRRRRRITPNVQPSTEVWSGVDWSEAMKGMLDTASTSIEAPQDVATSSGGKQHPGYVEVEEETRMESEWVYSDAVAGNPYPAEMQYMAVLQRKHVKWDRERRERRERQERRREREEQRRKKEELREEKRRENEERRERAGKHSH
ncbi:hypothetical protein B0H11DRAFT_2238427 [Mycena galericulata]|nr:hypothetical protein B0H11DRAFT_2238427 [Mycena galericulata]